MCISLISYFDENHILVGSYENLLDKIPFDEKNPLKLAILDLSYDFLKSKYSKEYKKDPTDSVF